MPTLRQQRENVLAAIVIVGLLLGFFYYIVYQTPVGMGIDYVATFHPAAKAIINGDGNLLYRLDREHYGWFNLPWLLFLLLPLQAVSLDAGIVIWNTASLLAIVGAIHLWRQRYPTPTLAVAFALVNLHTIDFMMRAQVDAVILLAAVLSWWFLVQKRPVLLAVALVFLFAKPLNVLLLGGLFALNLWRWPRVDQLSVMGVLALVGIVCLPIFGFDYPLRYLDFAIHTRPIDDVSISIWKAADQLHIPLVLMAIPAVLAMGAWLMLALRRPDSVWTFTLAIATTFFVTTYANGNHYVLLMPALFWVASHNRWLATLAYLATWTPLLRAAYGFDVSWADIGYPAILMLSLWYLWWREQQQAEAANGGPVQQETALAKT